MRCLCNRKITHFLLLIFATITLIIYLIRAKTPKDRIQEVLSQRDPHGVKHYQTKTPNRTKVWCLLTRPGIQQDEIISISAFTSYDYYCEDDKKNITLGINFNIERTFKFRFVERERDMVFPLTSDGTRMGSSTDQKGIPKKFHFIWTDSGIPNNFIANLKRFHALHPTWEFNFWTLRYGRTLIKKLEPKLIPAFDKYAEDVSRADVLRYVLMYHIGGAYFDLDTFPRMPLDNFTMVEDCVVGAEPMEQSVFILGRRSVLSNAGFLCKPKHAFLRLTLDTLPAMSNDKQIMTATGPVFFSNCFNLYIYKQIFNQSKDDGSEPINLAVIRHDYFEFLLHKFFNPRTSCQKILPTVDAYAPYCTGPRQNVTKCEEAYHDLSPKELLTFEACLEWTKHGRDMRNLGDSIRYVDHLHLGVHNTARFLEFTNKKNMSDLVPGSNVHI